MRKHLFNACAAGSLLLLIGVIFFWTWCRSHAGYVRLHQQDRFIAIYPSPDGLALTTWLNSAGPATPQTGALNSIGSWPREACTYAYLVNRNGLRWEHLGVQWCNLSHLKNGHSLILPNGLLMGVFAVLPLLWLRRWSQARTAGLECRATPQLA